MRVGKTRIRMSIILHDSCGKVLELFEDRLLPAVKEKAKELPKRLERSECPEEE